LFDRRDHPCVPTCLPSGKTALAIAAVRRKLWAQQIYSISPHTTEIIKISKAISDRMANALAYAA
jgi:hypothetical protein